MAEGGTRCIFFGYQRRLLQTTEAPKPSPTTQIFLFLAGWHALLARVVFETLVVPTWAYDVELGAGCPLKPPRVAIIPPSPWLVVVLELGKALDASVLVPDTNIEPSDPELSVSPKSLIAEELVITDWVSTLKYGDGVRSALTSCAVLVTMIDEPLVGLERTIPDTVAGGAPITSVSVPIR